jgi:hypothetical protein
VKLWHFIILLVAGCTQPGIEGIWSIDLVEIDSQEMTPNRRWIEFKQDGSQRSGNGGVIHSYGSWKLVKDSLSIVNTNGLDDENSPFKIIPKPLQMQWVRIEEGQEVRVYLSRINEIPLGEADSLYGLWELNDSSTLFLRWDKEYRWITPHGRTRGIYHTSGHGNRLRLINDFGVKEEYEYATKGDSLFLKHDSALFRFKRIRQFH